MKKRIFLVFLIICFLINTFLVITNKTATVDIYFHNILYKDNMPYIESFMKFITFFGSSIFMIFLVILLMLIFIKNKRIKGFDIAGVMIISTLLNNAIKLIIKRPRPEYITVVEKSFSYPSGHTMASTSLYLLLSYFIYKSNLDKKYKILLISFLIILTLLIIISRIYLGAHYFSDVFGGFLLSLIILLCYVIYREKRV